jgi:hypothetical protein
VGNKLAQQTRAELAKKKQQGVAEGEWSNVIHTTDRSAEKAQREQEHKKQAGLAAKVLKNHSQALDPKEIDLLTRYNLHHRGKPGVRLDNYDVKQAQQLIQNVLRFNEQGVAEGTKRLPDIRQFDKTVLDKQFGGSMVKMAQALKDAGFSNERILQKISDFKQGVAEDAMSSLHAEMGEVYRKLAPKIERHRDSYLAGQLYDELEAVADAHGAGEEFTRMMRGARNRAHMDYDTNPGGFQNWFWYLPFDDEQVNELNKNTLGNYVKANANDQVQHASSQSFKSGQAGDKYNTSNAWDHRTTKREKGMDRAVRKLTTEEAEESSPVEQAIIRRIMVAHTDLLMKFGPDKVMQAAEEVAYNIGDVDEIGPSDVSAYVDQVRQILGVEAY